MHLARCCHRLHCCCCCCTLKAPTCINHASALQPPVIAPPSYLPCPAALLPAGNIYVQVDFATVCRLSVAPPSTRYPLPSSCSCSSSCSQPLAISAALSRGCACVCLCLCLSFSVCVHSSGTHDVPYPLSVRPSVVRCVRCPLSVVRCQLTGTVQCVLRRPRSAAAHLCLSRSRSRSL